MTHPYIIDRISQHIFRLHDSPRSYGDYRKDEYINFECAPEYVLSQAQQYSSHNYALCSLVKDGDNPAESQAVYKRLGCRLASTESLMATQMKCDPPEDIAFPIMEIADTGHANAIAKAWRRRQIRLTDIANPDALHRVYTIHDGTKFIGSVGSVVVGETGWIAALYVDSAYRRMGIGTALMRRAMSDNYTRGIKDHVLVASHTGAKLYPTLGYQSLGTLCSYNPPKL